MTVTNEGGGQPVSIENIRRASTLCGLYGVLFLLNVARYAENARLITQNEPEFRGCSPLPVAQVMFDLTAGCVAGLKEDGIDHVGGVIALRDAGLVSTVAAIVRNIERLRGYRLIECPKILRRFKCRLETLEPAA